VMDVYVYKSLTVSVSFLLKMHFKLHAQLPIIMILMFLCWLGIRACVAYGRSRGPEGI
jgi:hypothetical protein